ncbi:hypothetical protein Catovirus_2_279 [Catovirus CTV1]|uniref:Uncharacterized protein n=1 Tax=Catovirus CTV1 TaxID=1977631 RepID=A0A1V0SC89_9VIRU|nr:hypothetical protein Catovirus_2_279 [Catovirus CTV1]
MDFQTNITKFVKYVIVFAVIYLLTVYVPSQKMTIYESLIISMCAAILYAILDIFYPSYRIENKLNNNTNT